MANYQADLRDIFFNLFEVLKAQNNAEGMEAEDLKSIVEEYNKFVENEIFPCREEGDQVGVRLENGHVTVPSCFQGPKDRFHENGWFALGLPEDLGGVPVPHAVDIACGSLSTGANVAWMMYPGLTKAALNCILDCGSDEQKALVAAPMMEGRWGGTMCLTEAGAGSDVGSLKTMATPLGDGRYSIEGAKIFISSGDSQLYENIIHLVLARTPGAAEGTAGLSLFIVPKFKISPDGTLSGSNDVVCSKIEEKMGLHGQATCELLFGSQNKSCEGWVIGKEGEGMRHMFVMMNEARLGTGLQGEAQANLALMLTDQYVRERAQFGQEIIQHPDVKKHMLKIRAMSRGLRALCLYTGSLFDHKDDVVEIGILTPICKAYCSDQAMEVTSIAVQMHGGYGYCSEYGVEQFMRDTKIASIYEGTNGIQAIDLVMRKVLKDNGKGLMALGAKIQSSISSGCEGLETEAQSIGLSLQKTNTILESFGEKAKKGEFDAILTHCTDFLEFIGHLVCAWRLLESAKVAVKALTENPSSNDQSYYQSKISDLKVFNQYYLQKNISLGKLMLNDGFSLQDHTV